MEKFKNLIPIVLIAEEEEKECKELHALEKIMMEDIVVKRENLESIPQEKELSNLHLENLISNIYQICYLKNMKRYLDLLFRVIKNHSKSLRKMNYSSIKNEGKVLED